MKKQNEFKQEGCYPRNLLFQWHITNRCNLRCSHCYHTNFDQEDLEFKDLLCVLEQFVDFLNAPCSQGGRPIRGHITVTGGEPFIRQDFWDLLEIFSINRKRFSFAILTNGTLIDKHTAKKLKKLSPRFVQVSMDGNRETHDRIRGTGSFDLTVTALKHLVRAGIYTLISFTANRKNYKEFYEVAEIGMRIGVQRVWADRMVPQGKGAQFAHQILTPKETFDFFAVMKKAQRKAKRTWFCKTEIAMHRALQFLLDESTPYHCTAGDTLLTVLPNGDLYPCRRMPVKTGNLFETPLAELYVNSEFLRYLRDQENINEACRCCIHGKDCRGGLKCLSYAMTGDPFAVDSGCWMFQEPAQDKAEKIGSFVLRNRKMLCITG